jgi:hypothetical protein
MEHVAESPESPESPEWPGTPGTPETPETPGTPWTPETPETPSTTTDTLRTPGQEEYVPAELAESGVVESMLYEMARDITRMEHIVEGITKCQPRCTTR